MSSEESNKMSPKTPSQDLNFENPRPEEEIAWDIEEMKRAIIDNAEEYDRLLDRAGQEAPPEGSAEAMWEMEKKMQQQKEQQQ